jgi:hypothetical protein
MRGEGVTRVIIPEGGGGKRKKIRREKETSDTKSCWIVIASFDYAAGAS